MVVAAGLAVLAFSGVDELWPYFVLAFLGGAALVFDAPNRHALTFQLVGRDELPNAVALNSSPVQRRPGRRPGDRRRADRRGRGRLVLRDQRRVVPGGARRAAADAAVRALPARARRERGQDRGRDPRGPALRVADARRCWLVLAITAVVSDDRVQLPRAAAGAGVEDAALGRDGVRRAVRLLRGRRAARRARRPRRSGGPAGGPWSSARPGSAARCSCSPRSGTAVLAAALLLVVGFCFSTWTANSQSILQLTAPDRLRGRVLGLYLFVFAGFSPIGGLLAGWLADVGGTELAFAVAGVCGPRGHRASRSRACAGGAARAGASGRSIAGRGSRSQEHGSTTARLPPSHRSSNASVDVRARLQPPCAVADGPAWQLVRPCFSKYCWW